MWEALISSIFSVIKSHFDEIIMRISTWAISFILCWLFLPTGLQSHLLLKQLPGLPPYTLVYLFYVTAATTFWQMFFIILDVAILLIDKIIERKAIKPKTKWVEVDSEYKNYTFFKCHRLSLLLRIRKSSSSSEK